MSQQAQTMCNHASNVEVNHSRSQQIRSCSNRSRGMVGRLCRFYPSNQSCFHYASKVCHLTTRVFVRLLGPCFKTGRLKPFRQHPNRVISQIPTSKNKERFLHVCQLDTPESFQPPSKIAGRSARFRAPFFNIYCFLVPDRQFFHQRRANKRVAPPTDQHTSGFLPRSETMLTRAQG